MYSQEANAPHVSVIIPVYNCELYIKCAIESVLFQQNIKEVIVVDDGSTDGTLEIVRGYAPSVTLLTQSHQGAAAARNYGIKAAQGELIAFLDADDCWNYGKISRQLQALRENPTCEMVFGQIEEFSDSNAGSVGAQVRGVMSGVSPITILTYRSVFDRVGLFSTEWSRGEFIDWYARAKEHGVQEVILPDVLSRRRLHQANSGRGEREKLHEYARVVGAALQRRKLRSIEAVKTPVVLFIFNRPIQTQRVFEEIRRARPPLLFVIADGVRDGIPADLEKVAAARIVTEQVDWPCVVRRLYSPKNIGIKQSYDNGMRWVFEQCENAIIFEDDCLPHQSFFRFCEELLQRYNSDDRVMLISGMSLSDQGTVKSASYGFSRHALTWGWATWRRAWMHYKSEIQYPGTLEERQWLSTIGLSRSAVDYWDYMFSQNASGYTHWDIAWARSCLKHAGLAVHPHVNLISNIGFDENATHSRDPRSIFSDMQRVEMQFPLIHPLSVEVNPNIDTDIDQKIFGGSFKRLFTHVRKTLTQHQLSEL